MKGSEGTKMPRGTKEQMIEFPILNYEINVQQKNSKNPINPRQENRNKQPYQQKS